jgi:hypothetical protein
MTELGDSPLSDAQFDSIMKQIDTDSDGTINYSEFMKWLTGETEDCGGEYIGDSAETLNEQLRADEVDDEIVGEAE